jgi:hypothetical protein
MSDDFDTVEYQAHVAARHRPCAAHPCDITFPTMPSRWCTHCLIAALLRRLETSGDVQHYRQLLIDQDWERK